MVSTCAAIALYISLLPFPLSSVLPVYPLFHFLLARDPPLRMLPQPFSSMLYRIRTRAQKNCGKLQALKKLPSAQAFRYAGHGRAVTHPSTDSAPSCLTQVTAWCRTPTTHRTLSVRQKFISIKNISQNSQLLICIFVGHIRTTISHLFIVFTSYS